MELRVIGSFEGGIEALGMRIAPQPWMEKARCVYGNAPEFLGQKVVDPDTDEMLMTEDEFFALFDQHFFAEHDDRGASGSESSFLFAAVRECLMCPVWRECLRHAAGDRVAIPVGVAGATTPWERRVVMGSHNRFLRDLDEESRFRLLEKLVYAKAMGFVRWSVQADYLRKTIGKVDRLPDPEEGWDEFLRPNADLLDAEDAEAAAEDGDIHPAILEHIEQATASWASLTADDLERFADDPDMVRLLMRKE